MRGIVTKIDRFAVHDGPGIRTVIFLKGCPLRCKWCSSPETQKPLPEIGYNRERCARCGRCVAACPLSAISLGEDGVNRNSVLCITCGTCVEACPNDARRVYGKSMTVEEVFAEIEKDILFYQNSGGGVTLSGGEPTIQHEFCLALLKKCRSHQIHTAMESCLYISWDILSSLLEHLDLVYVDIKHMDPERCRELTGLSNDITLRNIESIVRNCKEIELILRLPLIPGCNDDEKNLKLMSEFAQRLQIKKIEILPYHEYGVATYKWLGRGYALDGLKPPEKSYLEKIKESVASENLSVQIGG